MKKSFLLLLAGTLALRLFIAVVLVFTGDEAYYYFWGLHPAFAYYDHPAMVGWLLAPFAWVSNVEWWIRLPAVLLLVAVAWLTVQLAGPAGERKAYLAGIAVMLVPSELLNILTTTDTPLVLFALWSVAAYQRALAEMKRGGSVNRWHWIAGFLLGAAFFSKYFAVLLGLGYLTHAVVAPRRERAWPGLLAVVAASMPWVAMNVYGNYEHCWLNILFNLYNRNDNVFFSFKDIANFLFVVLYTTSPILLWQLWRRRKPAHGGTQAAPADGGAGILADPEKRIVLFSCVVPLLVFAALSTVKVIGLHWVFAFSPLVFVLGAYLLDERELRVNGWYLGVLSAVHLTLVGIAWALPLETWSRSHLYDGLVLTVRPLEVFDVLRPYRRDYVFATDGYSNSVTLSYQARRNAAWGPLTPTQADADDFIVFGPGSAHGRQQDVFDDFRQMAGRNILIFRKTAPPPAEYAPFFREVEYRSFNLHGVTYHLVLGRGFDYRTYRDVVLAKIRAKFYAVPAWLPTGDCFFDDRYFGGDKAGAALSPSAFAAVADAGAWSVAATKK